MWRNFNGEEIPEIGSLSLDRLRAKVPGTWTTDLAVCLRLMPFSDAGTPPPTNPPLSLRTPLARLVSDWSRGPAVLLHLLCLLFLSSFRFQQLIKE